MKIGILACLGALLLVSVVALFQGCRPPKRDLTLEQVQRLDNMDELMWFLATVADPAFWRADDATPDSLKAEDLALFSDVGSRVPWAVEKLKEPTISRGPDFDKFSDELGAKAKSLQEAADSKNGEQAIQSALSLRETCRQCHAQFR